MSRVLLADDSPHAQRMGERILREEGFEVVTVTDGEAALSRLEDFDPDIVLADAFLPLRSGYDICRGIRNNARFLHVRVVLTAGALETLDEEEASRVQPDAILRKPFEASVLIETLKPLLVAAESARQAAAEVPVTTVAEAPAAATDVPAAPVSAPASVTPDPERVRAAVTLALDASLPKMIDEITEKVLVALGH